MTNPLPRLIERFFTQRLMRQRNASPHMIASYRDTFKLLLKFAHRRTGIAPSDLRLDAFDADLVVAFPDDLDLERRASPTTHNLRLSRSKGQLTAGSTRMTLCCRSSTSSEHLVRMMSWRKPRINSSPAGLTSTTYPIFWIYG